MITEKKDLHKDDEYAEPRLISHGKINLMICQGSQFSKDDGWQTTDPDWLSPTNPDIGVGDL